MVFVPTSWRGEARFDSWPFGLKITTMRGKIHPQLTVYADLLRLPGSTLHLRGSPRLDFLGRWKLIMLFSLGKSLKLRSAKIDINQCSGGNSLSWLCEGSNLASKRPRRAERTNDTLRDDERFVEIKTTPRRRPGGEHPTVDQTPPPPRSSSNSQCDAESNT